jgi:HK97 family phage major capsid protein
MKTSSLELRKQRAGLISQMQDLCEKTSFGDEAQKRWKELDLQQKQMHKDIMRQETAEEEQRLQEVHVRPEQRTQIETLGGRISHEPALPKQATIADNTRMKPFLRDLASSEYRDSFDAYMRFGMDCMTTSQRNSFTELNAEIRTYVGLNTSTSGDASGYTIPIGFQKELEIRMKAISQLRANARILNTSSGNPLDWPVMDDTSAEGEFLAEQNPVSQLNPSFGQIQFSSFLASSKQVKVSVQILQDSAFDLESELATAFGIRIGRIINKKYTLGTGSSEPQGLIYAIQNDSVPNVVKAAGSSSNDGVSGNTEANSVGSDDLDNLIAAVDPAYRAGCSFMAHNDTFDYLRKIKDKYGRPLWAAGLSSQTPDRIAGYPYFFNQSMDQIGANKYPICFGNFSKFLIRDVGGITMFRFSELFMSTHEVAFQAWLRTDSRRLQASAFSLLWNPLS